MQHEPLPCLPDPRDLTARMLLASGSTLSSTDAPCSLITARAGSSPGYCAAHREGAVLVGWMWEGAGKVTREGPVNKAGMCGNS